VQIWKGPKISVVHNSKFRAISASGTNTAVGVTAP
jgi:hypothetical protein